MSDFTRTRAALAEWDRQVPWLRRQRANHPYSCIGPNEADLQIEAHDSLVRNAFALDTGDPSAASASIDEIRAAIKEQP